MSLRRLNNESDRKGPMPAPTRAVLLVFLCLCGAAISYFAIRALTSALTGGPHGVAALNKVPQQVDTETVRELVASEELILSLTPQFKLLQKSVLNLQLPDHFSNALFASSFDVNGLGKSEPTSQFSVGPLTITERGWPTAAKTDRQPLAQVEIWEELFNQVTFFKHAKFKIVRGEYTDDQFERFRSEVSFSALARLVNGHWMSVHADIEIDWQRHSTESKEPLWQIIQWKTQKFDSLESDRLMFEDVLAQAVPDETTLARLSRSKHSELLLDYFAGRPVSLPKHLSDSRFFPDASNMHPALSVVDIDSDGLDDLYVMVRWGKNLLLRNRGDGTFEDIAPRLGLDTEARSTSGVFADFDNDGDLDLMLGRSLERSIYLMNDEGRFVDRSNSHVSEPLPYLVTSMSAADFNGDGLVDIYFSTYGPSNLGDRVSETAPDKAAWADKFLTAKEASEIKSRYKTSHRWLADVGPPNVLLVNRGDGRFERATENSQLAVWRNSFQGTWGDFDNDGDPDLYVANDFSPDSLFRNDRSGGFVDITKQAGVDELGYGMGASWGDYDNDGRLDMYVSNMFSKAGMRTTSQIADLDERFSHTARGNYLYHNRGDKFLRVSGFQSPAITVAKAGWSWGGQFGDLDNDGWLDLYVPSGYYTAPTEVESNVDL